jgi:hypothetical protein
VSMVFPLEGSVGFSVCMIVMQWKHQDYVIRSVWNIQDTEHEGARTV